MTEEKQKAEVNLHKVISDNKTTQAIPPNTKYIATRYIEMICIGACVFGALWEGTIRFNLTTPQFLMVYGGAGALITEVLARLFKKKQSIEK